MSLSPKSKCRNSGSGTMAHKGLHLAVCNDDSVPPCTSYAVYISCEQLFEESCNLKVRALIFSLLPAKKQCIPDISSTQSEYPQLQQLCRGNLLQPEELIGFLFILSRLTSAKYIYPVLPHNLGKEVNMFTLFFKTEKNIR